MADAYLDWTPEMAVLRLSGPDAAAFLHGVCTQDIQGMPLGAARHAFHLSHRGKILAEFDVLRRPGDFLLLVDRDRAAFLEENLRRFVVIRQVVVESMRDLCAIRAIGAGLRHLPSGDILRIALSRYGELDAVYLVTQEQRAALQTADPAWTLSDLERYRVTCGVPRFGADFSEENLPQETGLFDAISFKKGCYTGQEVVARLQFRGHVSKSLVRVEFCAASLSEEAVRALRFLARDKDVGVPSSLVAGARLGTPVEGEWMGFLYLPHRFLEEGGGLVSTSPGVEVAAVDRVCIGEAP